MAITKRILREDVEPGMMVLHKGRTMRASANTAKGLYLHSVIAVTRTTETEVEVLLDRKGRIEYSPL